MKENYKRFDVVLVDFGQVEFVGEQGGKRPCVILQNDVGNYFSGTTLVVPLTSKIKHVNQPTHLLFKRDEEKGLKVDSMVLGECLRQKTQLFLYLNRILKILIVTLDLKRKSLENVTVYLKKLLRLQKYVMILQISFEFFQRVRKMCSIMNQ